MIGRWTHVIALLAVLGCEGAPTPIDELQDEILSATCARAVRCGSVESLAVCRENFSSGSLSPDLRAAIRRGVVDYDGIAAKDCVDDLESGSCDPTSQSSRLPNPACDKVFEGQLPQGADCVLNAQCRSERCDRPDDCEDACCVGRCEAEQVVATIGQSCADVPCTADTFCDANETCAPLLALGDPCGDDSECWFGMVCGIAGDPQPRCMTNPTEGDFCVDGQRCPTSGLVCNERTATCERARFEGEPCDPQASLCASSYLHCSATTNTCAPFPGPGQPCVTFRCASGSYCDFFGPEEDLCQPERAVGEACGIAFECATGLCDGGVCVEPARCVAD